MIVNQHTLVANGHASSFLNYNMIGDVMIATENIVTCRIIKNMRLRAGLTQKQLGKLLNLSDMSISRYESGKVIPNFETVLEIARVCGFEIKFVNKTRVLNIQEMLREY